MCNYLKGMRKTLFPFERVQKDSQFIYLGGEEIPGVQSFNLDIPKPLNPTRTLGTPTVYQHPQGPLIANLSISANLITDDLFYQYISESAVNCFIVKDKNTPIEAVALINGYMTQYRTSYSIGELPSIESSFIFFGGIGQYTTGGFGAANEIENAVQISSTRIMKIPGPGSMSLSIDGIETNAIRSYDISINIQRNPIYSMGNKQPLQVKLNLPIEVICSFQIEVGDYRAEDTRKFPFSKEPKSLSLSVNTFDTGQNITSYNFNHLRLLNESFSMSVDGYLIANIQYRGYLN